MMMTPKSGVFLLGSCIAAIAAVGSVFELASGQPQLGSTLTSSILGVSIPLVGVCFYIAVRDSQTNL